MKGADPNPILIAENKHFFFQTKEIGCLSFNKKNVETILTF